MPNTFYDGTIPVLRSILTTLSHVLTQGTQHPKADTFLDARLIEDMYPLSDQVRLVTQFSENLVARLTGREAVTFEGKPATYAECFERIETVLKAVNEADKDVVNQGGDKVESTKIGPRDLGDMSGATYAHMMVLPNIYFHLTTAYDILRKEGVPLGKKDYFVGFFAKQ